MQLKKQQKKKLRLHLRNKNRESYDIKALKVAKPELIKHIKPNKLGKESIDFADPAAVKILNQALLKHYYGIDHWDFPAGNLCPPIPGRADYIHYLADLLRENNQWKIPKGEAITAYDVGVGANCIYPIIGVVEYNWKFIGSDINPKSIEAARHIIEANEALKNKVECKFQENQNHFFKGIINENDKIDLSICNPPFHKSAEEAEKSARRKLKNLTGKPIERMTLNFAGSSNELVFEGGEGKFIKQMIKESKKFAPNFYWFSTLVSKKANLKAIYKSIENVKANKVKTIDMGTGNKISRIVAWTFLSKKEQNVWRETRWK